MEKIIRILRRLCCKFNNAFCCIFASLFNICDKSSNIKNMILCCQLNHLNEYQSNSILHKFCAIDHI